jgi:hypothetical protein
VLESFYEVERPRLAEFMRAAIALRRRNGHRTMRLRALQIYTLERLEADLSDPPQPARLSPASPSRRR